MSKRTYRALLIGNSTFPNDPQNLPDLEGPRNDPAVLRDALCDDRYGLFLSDNVRLVTERTMAEVLRETATFLHSSHRDDALLLYYSGHGRLDLSNELYLCARDTQIDLLMATAVKASDLRAMIDDSAASITVVIVDCCHSGAFKGGGFADKLAGKGRYVLTSSGTADLAKDSSASNRASLFTHHLVQGMLGEATDHDGDGLVVLDDLYRYTHARLGAEHRQIPERSYAGSGDIPMARRPSTTDDSTEADDEEETTVVDPSVAEPVLDVSPTRIAIEDVGAEEELPPERVAVINRGGGELTWSANCRSEWVTLERDQHGLLVHLRPSRPGANRANLDIRDDRTGRITTVRLIVRVVAPAKATSPAEKPDRDDNRIAPHRVLTNADSEAALGATPKPDPAPAPARGATPEPVPPTTPRTTRPPVLETLKPAAPPSPNWHWTLRHSLWLTCTLPMGLTIWAGFLYVGLRAKRRSWIWTAAAYGVATIALTTFIFTAPTNANGELDPETWQMNVGTAATLLLWVIGIVHGLIANRDWLKWRAGPAAPTPTQPGTSAVSSRVF